ncbi:ATP-grasp domain-containing protein [Solimonas sp. K1W22B-7]|uniref:ATP-binding protein n=1 Tax=Solimonas sp. K1W22B-7 TaxID=2303331 RepID=UPI000E335850|nr:biotin carboxylase N-terminal domain-containing protein [Solimonas sp. K1W22B-7]AXQ31131.1 ATP-grasp domain-containing protein [Solimonas sp. K1W22B-7]
MRFDTVLIANRGEIAARVIRSARAQGYRTVAVYSDADAGAPHTCAADVAVRIGPAPVRESYLDPQRIIDAARRAGAQAIHPGYGFLSENAAFAEACAEAGLVFIGPPPDAIRKMGDKAAAKRLMLEAGVPLLAGYQGEAQGDEVLIAEARRIGYPVMVKAAAGGGGKGMRLVAAAEALPAALAAARREAAAAFGSDVLIIERAVVRPRHIEIQVLADEHRHVIALGERDCSVQRRHQKVIEEAPSPAVNAALREAMSKAAIAAARRVSYVGAGTVEFILDEDGSFAFLEMNTRLQVEHPVTEFITGLDLVAWQLRIAQGEPLTIAQEDVRLDGHAIEVRLYAEDPANGYLPSVGPVSAWQPPSGDGIRVDAGIAAGSSVSSNYDPMLAKIIAHGRDRDDARRRLIAALEQTTLLGVTTNRGFLADILRHPAFAAGAATTAFLNENVLNGPRLPTTAQLAIAAAFLHRERERAAERRSPGLSGWSNAGRQKATQLLAFGDHKLAAQLSRGASGLEVSLDGACHHIVLSGEQLSIDGVSVEATAVFPAADQVLIRFPQLDLAVRDVLLAEPVSATASGSGVLTAPMHGVVTAVFFPTGAEVAVGDTLLVLEAMKMEMSIVADVAGRIGEIIAAGTQVVANQLLARIAPTPISKQEKIEDVA